MGFLSRFFGKKPPETSTPSGGADADEHAVLLHIPTRGEMPTSEELDASHAMQDELAAAIEAADAGELDGDEWGGGEGVIFCYGPDADRLFEAMIPVLEKRPFPKGSHAIKRYGGPDGSRTERVSLVWEG
jgi:hypothetical protein